jgi:hypothetical protein
VTSHCPPRVIAGEKPTSRYKSLYSLLAKTSDRARFLRDARSLVRQSILRRFQFLMRYSLAATMSDAVNRKSMRMDTGALYDCMKNSFVDGMPQLISHDRHRLIGWVVPAAVYLEPGLNRVLSHLIEAQTPEDIIDLKPRWKDFIATTIHGVPEYSVVRLKELIGPGKLTGAALPWDTAVHALRDKGIAEKVFPDLFQKMDKDGLVPFSELEMIRPGVFKFGDLCLFAHFFMRRSESPFNNFNEELLVTLRQMSKEPDLSVRVRLDPDMVGLTETARHTIELDYWYGPKFTDDLASIQPGLTTHSADERQRLFHQISRTEFWWQKRTKGQDVELILEAEELRDAESGADRTKLRCRYVHSVIDGATQRIEHLDGSIRAYTQEEMLSRMDVDLKRAGRQTEYTKLWRMDGTIQLGHWKSVIHNHFRDNTLVSEYFGSTKSEPDVREELEKTDVFPRSLELDPRVVWRCDNASSFRILVTHQPSVLDAVAQEPLACSYTSAEIGDQRYGLFELRVLELKKILGHAGHKLSFPPNARFLNFEDDYLQFPIIIHRTPDQVEHTIEAYQVLLSKIAERMPSSPMLLNVSTALSHLTLSTSLFGRCIDVFSWLNRSQPFPTEANGADWVRDAAETISKFGEGVDTGLEYVQGNSLNLYPKRTMVDEAVDVLVAENEVSLEGITDTSLGVSDVELRTATRVVSATCSLCQQDYFNCPCSYIAQGAQAPTTDLRFACRYWAPSKKSRANRAPMKFDNLPINAAKFCNPLVCKSASH